MKIILVCSADYMAIPAALQLKNAGMLACIVIPEKFRQRLMTSFVQAGFDEKTIHTVNKDTLESRLTSLVTDHAAECVFVITFPWKIPKVVLGLPTYGFINFHPGLIPKYKGADPIFWQLKNREQSGGFTVHKMTDEIDEGPVIMTEQIPMIPGETYGIHHVRLGQFAANIVLNVVEEVKKDSTNTVQTSEPALYFKKPDKQQLTIDWQNQTAEEIEALVNATNPKYNGAYTRIRNMDMTILEVSFADINNPPGNVVPGTIVYADALYGLVVACTDSKFLKINTFCLTEGYLSGSKMFSLGFRVGEQFS